MNTIVVGIADCQVANDVDVTLVTYALGSCVAIVIHDPVARVGGILHFMLPDSTLDPVKGGQRPFMFADTGIPLLFRNAYDLGAQKRRIVVAAVGGAHIMDDQGIFNIGKRNCLAMRKLLWKEGVMLREEHLGGACSRTVRLENASGAVTLRSEGPPSAPGSPRKDYSWRTTS